MYIPCYSTNISYTWYIHVHTFHEMYKHVYTFLEIYKHVCTWYTHVYTFQSINMYIHGSDVYVHVYTSINVYTHVLISINMYIQCTSMYIHVCYWFLVYIHVCQCVYCWWDVYRGQHTFHEMYRHSWTVYVHWCILLIQLFICPAGWPVGRAWLLPGVTPSSSSTLV